jgi:hypothetical protein
MKKCCQKSGFIPESDGKKEIRNGMFHPEKVFIFDEEDLKLIK